MKRAAAFSSFGVTALVLALIVVLGFRTGGAQGVATDAAGGPGGITEAQFPFLGIARGEAARVHVINATTDMSSPSLRFMVMFVDHRGMLVKPEETCEVRSGETCTITLTASECVRLNGSPRNGCDFRALVVPEILPAPPAGVDGGAGGGGQRWSADVEILEGREGREGGGSARLVLSPIPIMAMPVAPQTPGPDGGGFNPDGGVGNPDSGVIGNPDGGSGNPDGGGIFNPDGGVILNPGGAGN